MKTFLITWSVHMYQMALTARPNVRPVHGRSDCPGSGLRKSLMASSGTVPQNPESGSAGSERDRLAAAEEK